MPVAEHSLLPVSVLPENLREIRSRFKLTQEAVGKLLGIQKEQVSRIETGSRGLTQAEQMVLEAALLGRQIPQIQGN